MVSPIPLLPVSLLRITLSLSLFLFCQKKRNQNLACLPLGYLPLNALTRSLAQSIHRLVWPCYPLPEQGLVIRNRAEFQYCPSNIVASKDKRSRNYSLSPTTQGRPTITLNQPPSSPTHPTPHGIPAARYLVLSKISDTTRTFFVSTYSALTVDYPSFFHKRRSSAPSLLSDFSHSTLLSFLIPPFPPPHPPPDITYFSGTCATRGLT